jgi:hypothetical protein
MYEEAILLLSIAPEKQLLVSSFCSIIGLIILIIPAIYKFFVKYKTNALKI